MHLIVSQAGTDTSSYHDIVSASVDVDEFDAEEASTYEDELDINATAAIIDNPEVHLTPTTTWEGYVTWVTEDRSVFGAELRDKQRVLEPLTVEIDTESVLQEDRSLINEGAVFYWSIGNAVNRGQHFNYDDIRFRRLPNWTKQRIEQASAEADEMYNFFCSIPLTK